MAIARARQLRSRMTRPEAIMWNALRTLNPRGYHFRRQVPLGPYYADFACHHPRLVIEIDGLSHTSQEYVAKRDHFMESEGYRVIRVTNDHVLRELSGVMQLVEHALGAG